jgi:hypothetical protein
LKVKEKVYAYIVRYSCLLGGQTIDLSPWGLEQTHHRHFALLTCDRELPNTWRHTELTPSDGSLGPTWFEFYWLNIQESRDALVAETGALLDQITAEELSGTGSCYLGN